MQATVMNNNETRQGLINLVRIFGSNCSCPWWARADWQSLTHTDTHTHTLSLTHRSNQRIQPRPLRSAESPHAIGPWWRRAVRNRRIEWRVGAGPTRRPPSSGRVWRHPNRRTPLVPDDVMAAETFEWRHRGGGQGPTRAVTSWAVSFVSLLNSVHLFIYFSLICTYSPTRFSLILALMQSVSFGSERFFCLVRCCRCGRPFCWFFFEWIDGWRVHTHGLIWLWTVDAVRARWWMLPCPTFFLSTTQLSSCCCCCCFCCCCCCCCCCWMRTKRKKNNKDHHNGHCAARFEAKAWVGLFFFFPLNRHTPWKRATKRQRTKPNENEGEKPSSATPANRGNDPSSRRPITSNYAKGRPIATLPLAGRPFSLPPTHPQSPASAARSVSAMPDLHSLPFRGHAHPHPLAAVAASAQSILRADGQRTKKKRETTQHQSRKLLWCARLCVCVCVSVRVSVRPCVSRAWDSTDGSFRLPIVVLFFASFSYSSSSRLDS